MAVAPMGLIVVVMEQEPLLCHLPRTCLCLQVAAVIGHQLLGMWYRRTASDRAATEARAQSMQGAWARLLTGLPFVCPVRANSVACVLHNSARPARHKFDSVWARAADACGAARVLVQR